jgi:hypothetical protein
MRQTIHTLSVGKCFESLNDNTNTTNNTKNNINYKMYFTLFKSTWRQLDA